MSPLLFFVYFIQRSKNQVDERVRSCKILLQHKANKIQDRELDENKQDFALNANKQLLIAIVISKYKV